MAKSGYQHKFSSSVILSYINVNQQKIINKKPIMKYEMEGNVIGSYCGNYGY